jgi:tetratricopeptide (TPR) repeat protein
VKRSYCLYMILALSVLTSCYRDPAKRKAALLSSGEKYMNSGRYKEAVIQFRNAIQIDPEFAEAHYQLATAYIKLQSVQEAFRELSTTVELDPRNTDAQLRLAVFLIGMRRYDDAQRAAEKVIAADPRNARAHSVLAEKYAVLQVWTQAIQEFQTAIDLDPAQVENYARLSIVYLATGRTADAETTLRQATQVQPKSPEALLNLGRYYLGQHRLAQAEATLRAASDVAPNSTLPKVLLTKAYLEGRKLVEAEQLSKDLKRLAPNDPDGYGAPASFYEATGQQEKAAAELRALLAARPKDAAIKARLISTLINLNRTDEAGRLNQEILTASPAEPHALISKGRILIAQDKYGEAKNALDQAVQSDPQSAAAHYFLGVVERSLDLTPMSKASFTRALELAPGWEDATLALADVNVRSGDYSTALRLVHEAQQKNPDSTLAAVVGANASIAKGDLSQAEEQLKAALDRDPLFLPALEAILDVQTRQGRTREAIGRISTLVSQHAQNARLLSLLALAYFRVGDLARSEVSIKQAIALDGNTPDAYGLLAEISRARGALDQAVTWYQAAIKRNPDKPENYMSLAALYEEQGNWEEAKRVAERAHSLDPASPFIANNLAYLYLDHGGDINAALSLAQQAKQKLPDSPVVSDTIGWAYYKLGSPRAAITQLGESVRGDPNNPTYNYHLGMAYLAAGRIREAARSLEQALSANPNFSDAPSAKTALNQISKGARQ